MPDISFHVNSNFGDTTVRLMQQETEVTLTVFFLAFSETVIQRVWFSLGHTILSIKDDTH